MERSVKKLTKTDLEAVKDLFLKSFGRHPWQDDWSDLHQLDLYMKDLMENPNSLDYGLYEEERLIGIALGWLIHWWEGTEYQIQELCIDPDHPESCLGSEFLMQIEQQASADKIRYLLIPGTKAGKISSFYHKRGYEPLKDHVLYSKCTEEA